MAHMVLPGEENMTEIWFKMGEVVGFEVKLQRSALLVQTSPIALRLCLVLTPLLGTDVAHCPLSCHACAWYQRPSIVLRLLSFFGGTKIVGGPVSYY
eukprot:254875-Rhodomonas_salina.2